MNNDEIRKFVRERYAQIATGDQPAKPIENQESSSCCAPESVTTNTPSETTDTTSCCAPGEAASTSSCCSPADTAAMAIGYSAEELQAIPEEARMGLGCGNPTALASLKEGEVVLDLGAGGGIDCFLAAVAVGKTGKAIGVDMTPEMLHRARDNARNGGYNNVEFRLGEIENLPVADETVDAVISNCVINLSPDKSRVFGEAYRVLKPGGRVMVSDIVLLKELPEDIRNSLEAYAGCVAGGSMREDYLATITNAGFENVEIVSEQSFDSGELAGAILSVSVRAFKPK